MGEGLNDSGSFRFSGGRDVECWNDRTVPTISDDELIEMARAIPIGRKMLTPNQSHERLCSSLPKMPMLPLPAKSCTSRRIVHDMKIGDRLRRCHAE
jgi:hypothetical protein